MLSLRNRVHARREYFRDAPDLRSHITTVRATYGDPDQAWPTMIPPRPVRKRHPLAIIAQPQDMLTAAEAEQELGIRRGTIYVWANRRRVQPLGRDQRNRQLFSRAHLLNLREQTRRHYRSL